MILKTLKTKYSPIGLEPSKSSQDLELCLNLSGFFVLEKEMKYWRVRTTIEVCQDIEAETLTHALKISSKGMLDENNLYVLNSEVTNIATQGYFAIDQKENVGQLAKDETQ